MNAADAGKRTNSMRAVRGLRRGGVGAVLLAASALGCRARVSVFEPLSEPLSCVCGEPLEEVAGCPFWKCVAGAGVPENPDCACYPTFDADVDDGSPRDRYRAVAGRLVEDGVGELDAARAAAAAGLYGRARAHVHAAVQRDGGVSDEAVSVLDAVRAEASAVLLAAARDALAEGRVGGAQSLLADLCGEFPFEPATAAGLTLLLDEVAPRALREDAELWDGLVALHPEGAGRAVAAARVHWSMSREAWVDGLAHSARASRAKHAHERAMAFAGYALRDLVDWRDAHASEADAATRGLERLSLLALVRASRALALIGLREDDPARALRSLEPALALAPSEADVRRLGHRIQTRAVGRGYGSWYLAAARSR